MRKSYLIFKNTNSRMIQSCGVNNIFGSCLKWFLPDAAARFWEVICCFDLQITLGTKLT